MKQNDTSKNLEQLDITWQEPQIIFTVSKQLYAGVDNASGRVDDKDRKESLCRIDLYKLNMFVEKEEKLRGE